MQIQTHKYRYRFTASDTDADTVEEVVELYVNVEKHKNKF